jgi:F-type H+-transporting ATPase subunit b
MTGKRGRITVLKFDIPTFIFVIINMLVLYFILKRLLFKPVTAFMEKRSAAIKSSLDNAERNRAEADKLLSRYEEQIKTADTEAESILSQSRANAGLEYEATVAQAKKDADEIIAKAHAAIEYERQEMLRQLKAQAAGIALAAASKVIQENMDTADNTRLVERFINEEGAA